MTTAFEKLLERENISLNETQLQQLHQYCLFLQEYNEKVNLTAITGTEEIYSKHFFDCLLLAASYDLKGRIADVGSGAGFPGVILKIYDPTLEVTLLEPIGKKASFLRQLSDKLGLEIEVANQRAEEYVKDHREQFDFVTARAVASLNILSELCIPLLKTGGHFLAMKGPKAYQEIEEAANALKVLHSEISSVRNFELTDDQQRIIIDMLKKQSTALKYPRAYAQIRKKPL
ncbi:MAG: 16S rRNA (guanine(527)-N(7))-methyltransferase RsmG [Erysipelotrichaceae bacterium]|nr:16S rRNA (guanine(527)-N(7))-methyltransferase RsmG [Erysipelotrichaceae bacterium]